MLQAQQGLKTPIYQVYILFQGAFLYSTKPHGTTDAPAFQKSNVDLPHTDSPRKTPPFLKGAAVKDFSTSVRIFGDAGRYLCA